MRSGGRSKSDSRRALSRSPHWRSSMASTSGRRSPIRASSSRKAANARRRSSSWSGTTCGRERSLGHRLDPPQHGKNLRQRRHIPRHEGVGLAPGQPAQVPGERVDQRVNRLVRHRLLFVAPPGQYDRLAALEQPLQESLDERALADPRAAVNEHGHRLALAHVRDTPHSGRQAATHGPRTAAAERPAVTLRPPLRPTAAGSPPPTDARPGLAPADPCTAGPVLQGHPGTAPRDAPGLSAASPSGSRRTLPSCGSRPVSAR